MTVGDWGSIVIHCMTMWIIKERVPRGGKQPKDLQMSANICEVYNEKSCKTTVQILTVSEWNKFLQYVCELYGVACTFQLPLITLHVSQERHAENVSLLLLPGSQSAYRIVAWTTTIAKLFTTTM